MLLNSIVLQDFGAYGGRHKFDLLPRDGRPVVLLGGTNGSGKTTLFKSIRLCLYGRNSMPAGTTLKRYHEAIMKIFHKDRVTEKSADEASISLKIQYGGGIDAPHFTVTRSWRNSDGRVDETMHVIRSDVPEDRNMAPAERQTFIDRMLPRGTADLFFFDGEHIRNMAESGRESVHIKSSLDALLGLDAVIRLHRDIGLHVLRSSGADGAGAAAEIATKTAEKRIIMEKIDGMMEKMAFRRAEVERFRSKLASIEDEFHRIGGRFAEKRQSLAESKGGLEYRLNGIEEKIRSTCSGVMPMLMLPEMLEQLQKDLAADIEKTKSIMSREVVGDVMAEFWSCVKSARIEHASASRLLDVMQGVMKKKYKTDGSPAFGFSLDELETIRRDAGRIDRNLPEMAGLGEEHDAIRRELTEIKSMLDAAPQLDEVGPLFSKITEISCEIGEMEGEIQMLTGLVAQERSLLTLRNAEIRKLLAGRKKEIKAASGLEMAPKVQDALEEFAQRLRDEKAGLLEINILECIRRLFHKKDFVTAVSVDRDTFDVTMMRHGTVITRDMLSPGESQMHTTAIMWGIAMTSGRRLPFVIDTPLARLDVEHRRSLVDDFYPNAARQIIIFSTDSEIAGSHYDRLRPHISHTILITYDAERGAAAADGYFEEPHIEVR